MKTLLRILIMLLIVLWLGAVMFFPAIAAVAFHALPVPQAGLVVRNCLSILHTEGLAAGTVLLILLVVANATRLYGRALLAPILCVVAMLLLTAFSQRSIMPRMETDRLAAGGDIDKTSPDDPHRIDFNKLHNLSEQVEEGVLVAGILLVVLLVRPPQTAV